MLQKRKDVGTYFGHFVAFIFIVVLGPLDLFISFSTIVAMLKDIVVSYLDQ